MSQTGVPSTASVTVKQFSVALFAYQQRANGLANMLTGPAPKQAEAEAKMKGQTSADMPIVRVTDLAKARGDKVSMDLFNIIGGYPMVGDVNREGRGEKLSWTSMEAKIDKLSKVVDGGGEMAQQRTVHNLRGIAMASLVGYFPRLDTQQSLVALAGARGIQDLAGLDWVIPPQFAATTSNTDNPDFAPVMVNAPVAPTYNRHYVKTGGALAQGGANLSSIAITDLPKLSDIDDIRRMIDNMAFPIQPVRIADDPAKDDEPLYVMLMPPSSYSALLTDLTASNNIRSFQQQAWERKSYGSKHPLFMGEIGMWNGILVKKISRSIRWAGGDNVRIITQANRYTATETAQAVNSIAATHVVERSLLLGAQALANVYGKDQGSDYFTSFKERTYNFDDNYEAVGSMMNGKAKVRLQVPDSSGTPEPTDLGVFAFDFAARAQ